MSFILRMRRRPMMWFGSTGARDLHHSVNELVSNSIDEARAGYGNEISVELLADGGCRVRDSGRGIPVHSDIETGLSILDLCCTQLYASKVRGGAGPFGTIGLHRTGLTGVNAVSLRMRVEVERDGHRWLQEYQRGEAVADLCGLGRTERMGTTVTIWPDPEIFRLGAECRFSRETIASRLRELAFVNRSLTFRLIDLSGDTPHKESFHYPGGLADYVRFLKREEEAIHPTIFHFAETDAGQQVEIALQWMRSAAERVRTYCNDAFTVYGGDHQTGFRTALTGTLWQLLRERGLHPRSRLRDVGARLRRGLTGVVAVNLPEPLFDSMEKRRLCSPETKTFVSRSFVRHFRDFLRRHPKDADAIVGKVQSNFSVP
jgi:DNA gyrase subunit B